MHTEGPVCTLHIGLTSYLDPLYTLHLHIALAQSVAQPEEVRLKPMTMQEHSLAQAARRQWLDTHQPGWRAAGVPSVVFPDREGEAELWRYLRGNV